jgi:tape measure domain-containing protein
VPNYVVGGIEASVEPSFDRFRPALRRGLREEERHAPKVHVGVEPKVTQEFQRELNRAIRRASAGSSVKVDVHPQIGAEFKRELVRQVTAAAAGVTVDVKARAVVDESEFKRELQRQVTAAAAGVTVEIEAQAKVPRGFKASLQRQLAQATAGVSVSIEATPTLSTGFRTMLQIELDASTSRSLARQIKERVTAATTGVHADIEVRPKLEPRFRVNLNALVQRSVKGLQVRMPIKPVVERTFRRDADVLLKKAMARHHVDITLEPRLARDFRAKLRRLAKSQAEAFPVTVEIVTETGRTIRHKLVEAIREATTNPPLVARVHVEPLVGELKRKTHEAVRQASRGLPKLNPTIDSNSLRRRLISDTSQMMAAANRIAKLQITTIIPRAGRAGLDAFQRSMAGLRSTARTTVIGLAAVTAAIGAVGAAGLKSAADFEFTRKNFGILLQDAQKGEEIFQGLRAAAAESIYELPDLQPLVQNLLVVNRLKPEALDFSDVIPTFQAVTDLGATLDITGPALTRVGLALAKIAGRGKLTGEELRSISKNAPGLNAIQLIADDLGVTVPEAFDKIRAGAVSSDEALRILFEGIKNFPGAAGAGLQEVTETFKGALSNLPDILRGAFFDAFEKKLPEITKIIAPGGPLVTAFERAAPALSTAFVPMAQTFFDTLADMALAVKQLFETVAPIFVQLGRASETVGLQLRRGFGEAAPGMRDLAESVATLLAGLSPGLPVLGQLVSLIASGLTRALDTLISTGAVDVVLDFFSELRDVAAELIPVLADVVAMVGEALMEAVADIDLADLGESLGTLAQAAGDLLVALAPALPVLVDLAATFAESLAPALEASVPLVEALVVIITPLAEVLARMAPGVLVLLGIAKAALGLANAATAVSRFSAGIKNLKQDLVEGNLGITVDETGITRSLQRIAAAAAVAAGTMASYFAAASTDVVAQIGGIVTSIGAIATAFATGGPIAAGIAAIGVALGAVFGNISRQAREAREEARRISELANTIQASFKITGVNTAEDRIIGIVDAMSKLVDTASGEDGKGAREFFDRFNGDVAKSAVLLEDSQEKFSDYARDLVDNRISEVFRGNQTAVRDFADEIADGLQIFEDRSAINDFGRDVSEQVRGLISDFREGGVSLDELRNGFRDLGFSGENLTLQMNLVRGGIREAIEASAGAKFGFELDDSVLQAIEQQQQLQEVSRLLKSDVELLSDAWSGFQGATNAATEALRQFKDAEQGDAANAEQVLLNGINLNKELMDIQKQLAEGTITATEAELKRSQAIGRAADENRAAVGRLLVEAGGDYDVFRAKLDALRFQTFAGLRQDFIEQGKTTDEATRLAKELTDQLIEIPNEHEFNIASNLPETKDAALELERALQRISDVKMQEIRVRFSRETGEVFRGASTGALVRRPQVFLTGEDGPELILPLTKPERMAELLAQAQREGLLPAAGLVPGGPVAPGAAPGATLGVGVRNAVDPEAGREFTNEAARSIQDLGPKMLEATDPGLNRWQERVGSHLEGVTERLGQFGGEARAGLQGTMNALAGIATTGSAGVVSALRGGLDTGTSTVGRIVRGYARKLAESLNPVLEAIGQPKINLGEFRKGGVNNPRIVPDGSYDVHVFGERGTHGEAYIPFDPKLKSSSRAIADETVRRLGGRAQWFRTGGITGDTRGMDAEFLRRLGRWSERVGMPYHVDSGYRSFEAQRRLYQRYLANVPGQAPAAPPGRSMHNFGLASDGSRWSGRSPGDFGLRFPMSYEPWHVEPNEARAWAAMGDRRNIAIVPLAQVPGAGAFGQLSITGKKAMEFTYNQALAWAGRQAMSGLPGTMAYSGDGSAGEAAARQWAMQALALTGAPASWLPGLMTLMRRESNFDPRAINLWDSNARRGTPSMGIAQMILPTFLRWALDGLTDIWNPVHNLASAIRYIESKGGIERIQQANPNLPPKGYEDGAIVYTEHMARVAEKNKPEVIIPLTNPARAMALAERSGVAGMVRAADQAYHGPKVLFEEGSVVLQVGTPAAERPETYAASMANRIEPALAAAIERAFG